MAKKALLRDHDNIEILPITRGELVLDSSGKEALHSNEFLASNSRPGLMSAEDKAALNSLAGGTIDSDLSTTSTNPVQNKVVTNAINSIKTSYLKSATVSTNTLTIVDQSNKETKFYNTTYGVVTQAADGLAPKLGTDASATIGTQADEWVLTSTKGSAPTWRKLPANAFKNDNNNTTYTFASGNGGFTVTPSGGTSQTVSIGKPATAGTADKLVCEAASTNSFRHVWFSYDGEDGRLVYDNDFTYNPATNVLNVGSITGSAGSVAWGNITGRPDSFTPSAHNHATSTINALTGYTKATAIAAIATTDSLNTALGKLELKADTAYNLVKGAYDGDGTIENLAEILKVLEGISDTDTIQAIVGKYLPLAGGMMSGNITFDTNRMIRWHQSDSYSISCPTGGDGAYLLLKAHNGITAKKRLSVYTNAESLPNTNYNLYTDGSLYAASAVFGGNTKITNGSDLTLQASSGAQGDAGDIVFSDYSGAELGRIWLDSTASQALSLRYGANDAVKRILHSGNSSVSKSGQTLTVKINGVEQSITNSTYSTLPNPYNISFKDTSNNTVTYNGSSALDLTGGIYYAVNASKASTLDCFTRRATANCTWGTLTASNGYTPIYWGDSASGGGIGFSDKGGQTFMQIDGDYYAQEGAYKVWHAGNLTKVSQLTNDSGYLTSLPSHNHDGRYAWGNYASQSDLSDCNSVSSTGFWTHSGFTHRPDGVENWGSLMNIRLYSSNNNYHRQLFFDCYGSDKIWTRSDNGGSWTSWKRLALVSDIPTSLPANGGNADTATSSTSANYSRNLLGRTTSGTDYAATDGNLVFAEWNTHGDSRWCLKAKGYETRVGYANNSDKLDGIDSTRFLRKVTVANNVENDFNTFESMTLTGRGEPTTGASLKNAPWSGQGPAGGYGVLTYLWSSYGTQMAWGYNSNRIYIRPKYYSSGVTWSSTWDSLALTSDIPTKVSQLTNDLGFLTQHQSLANYVTLNTAQTITGLKTFESASNTVGVSLILKNKNWYGGMSTAIDFYTGGSKSAVSSRIEDYMNGDGSAGGCLRFFTQSKSDTNPNPSALVERFRIDNSGYIRIYGTTVVSNNIELGSYGILGFGSTIPTKYIDNAAINPDSSAVWLASTGGGEATGIMLDGNTIKMWSPMDSPIKIIDSDAANLEYDLLHTGNIDSHNLTTITKTLTVTKDWMDIGIKNTDLTTGTYAVQVYVHSSADGIWYGTWSGIMSWYGSSTNGSRSDEILLHCAGHAVGPHIYLRTSESLNSAGTNLRLQIAASKALTSASYTFKFKKLI